MIRRISKRLIKIWRHTPFGRTHKTSDAVRWGIIGLGYMGETFANAIDGNRNGYVAAVASRTLSKALKFASRHGNPKAYASYEEMLMDSSLNLDVVYIATPVKCHYENIKMCLKYGKNVLCEKPITFSASQLEELMALAKEKGCFLMEGMWMKCLPSFRKAQQWISEGKIGEIQLIKADFYKREVIRPGYAIYDANEGGGVIRDFGIYALAFIIEFLGGLPQIVKTQTRYSIDNIDTDWQIMAERGSRKAAVNLSSDFGSLSKAAVIGPDGFIEWDSQFNRTNMVRLYDKTGQLKESFKAGYRFEGFEYEVDEVQRCIKEGLRNSSVVAIEQSLETIKTLDIITSNHR